MGVFGLATRIVQSSRCRAEFKRLCHSNQLQLEHADNLNELTTLKEIFYQRVYADYFPFYQQATVLDLGAHKGYFSLFAVKNLAPSSRIVAVEPYAGHVSVMRKNFARNGVDSVDVVKSGVADHSGSQPLHLAQSENHSLFERHSEWLRRGRPKTSVNVEVRSLKDLLSDLKLDHVDFLKMDCEGAEYPTLLSADGQTLAKIQTISLEFHDLKDQRYTGLRLAQFLATHGFMIVKLAHGATTIDNNHGYLVAVRS